MIKFDTPLPLIRNVAPNPDKMRKMNLTDIVCVVSRPNPIFDHLLESSRRDDSNVWSKIGFCDEIGIVEIKICTLFGALERSIVGKKCRYRPEGS